MRSGSTATGAGRLRRLHVGERSNGGAQQGLASSTSGARILTASSGRQPSFTSSIKPWRSYRQSRAVTSVNSGPKPLARSRRERQELAYELSWAQGEAYAEAVLSPLAPPALQKLLSRGSS